MRAFVLISRTIATLLILISAPEAASQLRPLEPFEWRMYETPPAVALEVGGAAYADQRAALAGAEGTLFEAGYFRGFWRTGRVVFEAAGTLHRFFREERSFASPEPYVRSSPDGRRSDSGDYLVISTVRITSADAPFLGVVRFGTRLPTTDRSEGLERDITDFFALLGASIRRGAMRLGVEAGVSINGSRDPVYEQQDVMPYVFRAEYRVGPLVPAFTVTGDALGPRYKLRGNEQLGEARLGLRSTGRYWLRAEAVAGFRPFSPHAGLRVTAGSDW